MQQSFDLNLQSLYKVVRVTLCQLLQQGKEEGLFTWKMGEEEDRVSSQHNSQIHNFLTDHLGHRRPITVSGDPSRGT